jgi:indolepyruvate ferredoxin oxidoreductase beta subunit
MRVKSTRLPGFLRLRLLAGLKWWRPRTLRFAEEEAWITRWLDIVARTLAVSPRAAGEVVAAAGLVRGYSDTYQRGLASFAQIAAEVVEPMLSGRLPQAQFADAVLQARLAAAKDATGAALRATIAAVVALAPPAAAGAPPRG